MTLENLPTYFGLSTPLGKLALLSSVGRRVRWNILRNQNFPGIVIVLLSCRSSASQNSPPPSLLHVMVPNHKPHTHRAVKETPFLHWMPCLAHAWDDQSSAMFRAKINWEGTILTPTGKTMATRLSEKEMTTQIPSRDKRCRDANWAPCSSEWRQKLPSLLTRMVI